MSVLFSVETVLKNNVNSRFFVRPGNFQSMSYDVFEMHPTETKTVIPEYNPTIKSSQAPDY